MGAQLPARWPGGSERPDECQIVPWIDWKALWPVSCSALLGGGRVRSVFIRGFDGRVWSAMSFQAAQIEFADHSLTILRVNLRNFYGSVRLSKTMQANFRVRVHATQGECGSSKYYEATKLHAQTPRHRTYWRSPPGGTLQPE